ncbi:hypothetical protein WJX81_002425 [Elliptochloris bilobata]|uniref:Major facilitator superfamily (MFS) profile domain-containing protein n=1 Tax=Elliptochloris bilobata TaxID=381761 RepID=A0AAW1RPS2_9CHLO
MLLRVSLFAALGGFLYGYDMGLIGGALVDIRRDFNTSEGQDELIVGATKVGAVFGTFLGGALMVHYGRRVAIALDSIFFVGGPLLMAVSHSIAGLVVGRLLVGFGIGISAVVVPAYLGEVAPAGVRGRIVEVYEVLLCLGMLMAVLADWGLQHVAGGWRWMVGLPVLPALVLSAALVLLPESPRWLVVQGRLDEALAVMHRVLTNVRLPQGAQRSTAEVEDELLALWSSVEKDKAAAKECVAAATGVVRRRRRRAGGRSAGDAAARRWKLWSSGADGRWQQLQESGAPSEGFRGSGMKALGAHDSSPRALQRALSDPQSPLFRTLSSVPQGLPPIRTRSNPEEMTTDSDVGSIVKRTDTARLLQAAPGFWHTQGTVLAAVWHVLQGPERRALILALVIAFIDQAMASTAVVNYAPEMLMRAGLPSSDATLWTSAIPGAKVLGVGITLLLVDSAGRRPLMLWGSAACTAALLLLAAGDWRQSPVLMLAAMCLFLLAFSASYAGLFWILCSELFSMQAKAPAASAATAMLFAGGAAADLAFLSIHSAMGAGSFLVFGAIAAFGGVYCWVALPETKGRSLAELV